MNYKLIEGMICEERRNCGDLVDLWSLAFSVSYTLMC